MIKLNMPEDTIGNLRDKADIALGPFVAVHNGLETLGGWMRLYEDGDAAVFYSDARSHVIDTKNYEITDKDGVVTAYSAPWASTWVFRSLEYDDIDWLVPEDDQEGIENLEALREWAKDQLLSPA